jgi:hypothetical protein
MIQLIPVVMPSTLAKASNGHLNPLGQSTPVYFPGYGWGALEPTTKRCWDAFAVACLAATGKTLSVTPGGAYRSYEAQVAAFNQRMSPTYNPLTCTTTTRTWNGKKYWLKRGFSPCATPGTSNHGWGLAVDTAIWPGAGQRLAGITSDPKVWTWVKDNAVSFGWSWEGAREGQPGFEPWHLRHVTGDVIPAPVLAIEKYFAGIKG